MSYVPDVGVMPGQDRGEPVEFDLDEYNQAKEAESRRKAEEWEAEIRRKQLEFEAKQRQARLGASGFEEKMARPLLRIPVIRTVTTTTTNNVESEEVGRAQRLKPKRKVDLEPPTSGERPPIDEGENA